VLTVDFDKLGVRENHLVLDAGCGFGRHSLEYMRRGARVFSMDMDMESLLKTRFVLAELQRQGSRESSGFLVHSGDALKLPFRDETFDRIICAEVMEHVSDDYRACSELTRVLKKNGRIAITVPTFFSEAIYDCLTFEYFATPGGHVRKYLPKQLVKIMRQNGLEIYGVGFKHAFHTVWWMIRCVVGLHYSDHPITRGYHKFLHLGLYSNLMRRCERFSNYFFPKSIVIYAWKR
jgi:ubiquinone/menaquinone biosynthesis C-methylase UbiE